MIEVRKRRGGRRKGTPKTGGRKAGTPNKATVRRQEAFRAAFEGRTADLADVAKHDPETYVWMLMKLL